MSAVDSNEASHQIPGGRADRQDDVGEAWRHQDAEGSTVNRAQLRQLAEDRILDAECLLASGRPAGAYYLAGYTVECGLKACIMAHVEAAGAIFQDKKFSEKCWTHDLEELVKLANLKPARRRHRRQRRTIRQLGRGQGLEGDQPLRAENSAASAGPLRCD